jgi:hypothetical protein
LPILNVAVSRPRLGGRLPHDRHLLNELFRRGQPRTEEAVATPRGTPPD